MVSSGQPRLLDFYSMLLLKSIYVLEIKALFRLSHNIAADEYWFGAWDNNK